jgi:hypothetical protein
MQFGISFKESILYGSLKKVSHINFFPGKGRIEWLLFPSPPSFLATHTSFHNPDARLPFSPFLVLLLSLERGRTGEDDSLYEQYYLNTIFIQKDEIFSVVDGRFKISKV